MMMEMVVLLEMVAIGSLMYESGVQRSGFAGGVEPSGGEGVPTVLNLPRSVLGRVGRAHQGSNQPVSTCNHPVVLRFCQEGITFFGREFPDEVAGHL